ncbi:BLUF domain-containing protein [Parasphingorhabdus sp.]|uniref:BLUF domain-containing protein n=1 Tax=Parasphingorhabdus sp. TaxID=2709688 RepID=UPI003A8F4426
MPHQSITSLIYVSTARAGLDENEFLDIVDVAQRNNERFGLTGLIVFNGFNFIQYLEGDRPAVNDRLHHIGMDDRHSGLTILSTSDTTKRQFTHFNMAGRYLPSEKGLARQGVDEMLADSAVSDSTRTIFQSFLSLGGKQLSL